MPGLLSSILLAVTALLTLSFSASAQTAQPDSVPRELALALLAGVSGGSALRENAPAEGFPPELIPRGATVLGGMSISRGGRTVIRVPSSMTDAENLLRSAFQAAAWTAITRTGPPQMQGFVSRIGRGGRASAPEQRAPSEFCKNLVSVRFSTKTVAAVSMIVLDHQVLQSPCRSSECSCGSRAIDRSDIVGEASMIALLLMLLLVPATAVAQSRGEGSVSRELVSALFAGGDGPGALAASQIKVGLPPDGFPGNVLPQNAQVLGHLAGPTQATTIVTMPSVPDAAMDSLDARVRAGGFIAASETAALESGFMASRKVAPGRTIYCKRNEYLSIASESRDQGGTRLTFVHIQNGNTLCEQAGSAMTRNLRPDEMPFPGLLAPPSSVADAGRMGRSSSGSGATEMRASARLATTLSVAAVLRHYAQQIRADGWTPVDSAVTPIVGHYSFRKQHSDGGRWELELTVSAVTVASSMMSLNLAGRRY